LVKYREPTPVSTLKATPNRPAPDSPGPADK
jgi:hypothetical protein